MHPIRSPCFVASIVSEVEGVGDDVMPATSSVDVAWVVDSTIHVATSVCFEGKGLADVHGGASAAGRLAQWPVCYRF